MHAYALDSFISRTVVYCILTLSYFLPGADAEASYNNFFQWLDEVARQENLPCHSKTNGFARPTVCLNGVYHHLSPDEADNFLRSCQSRLMEWGARCTQLQKTAGSVLRASCSGRGQLSVHPVLVGPFQD